MNLMMLLEMAVTGFGDRIAVKNAADSLAYHELMAGSAAVAHQLEQSGALHLAMLDESSLALPLCLFGSARAGVPFVPLNYRLTGPELESLLSQISPALLVTSPERVEEVGRLPGIQAISSEEFIGRAGDAFPAAGGEWPMDPDQIAVLLFTSGTTGPPKAAVIRHKHIVSYILGSVEYMGANEGDAGLVCVPPYHIAGVAALASSVYSGRRIVQLPRFDPHDWIELARDEKVTNAFVVPTMLARIIEALDSAESARLPDLRALSYGGGKMPRSVIERAMALFEGVDFTNAYGLTETSSTISILGPDDHRRAAEGSDEAERRRLVSVGKPLPTLELEIRDEDGKPVAAGERGEIYVRGEQVSGEYLGRRSTVSEDGWFPTRDAGSLDDEGYLFLEGRIDDVIVRGGENLSPGEIEDVLLAHDAVADVAVVGVPDEQWGEGVAAAVVLRDGCRAEVGELQAWVRERLRSSRTPERIEFWDELPYNETGKLLRRVVRAELVGDG